MRLYDRYVTALATLFMTTVVVLAAYDQHKLDLYFSIFLVEYLVTTFLFSHLNSQARRLLSGIGYVLFGVFIVIMAIKAIEIIVRIGVF